MANEQLFLDGTMWGKRNRISQVFLEHPKKEQFTYTTLAETFCATSTVR